MSFPSTHRSIREMIGDALLETSMSRAIVRKSGLLGGAGSGALSAELLQQYAIVMRPSAGTHSAHGSDVAYSNQPQSPFPAGGARLAGFWDVRGYDWMRLIATITEAGPVGSVLYIQMFQDVGTPGAPSASEVTFEGGAPSVPADSLGLHVSEWRRAEWFEAPEVEGRVTVTVPWLTNPSGLSGTIGVGLCQILVKPS